nr:MAG TPA: hypothetical protein [Caudoviricetes sp.]
MGLRVVVVQFIRSGHHNFSNLTKHSIFNYINPPHPNLL